MNRHESSGTKGRNKAGAGGPWHRSMSGADQEAQSERGGEEWIGGERASGATISRHARTRSLQQRQFEHLHDGGLRQHGQQEPRRSWPGWPSARGTARAARCPPSGNAGFHHRGHRLDVGLLRADVARQRQLREQQRQHHDERVLEAMKAAAQHGRTESSDLAHGGRAAPVTSGNIPPFRKTLARRDKGRLRSRRRGATWRKTMIDTHSRILDTTRRAWLIRRRRRLTLALAGAPGFTAGARSTSRPSTQGHAQAVTDSSARPPKAWPRSPRPSASREAERLHPRRGSRGRRHHRRRALRRGRSGAQVRRHEEGSTWARPLGELRPRRQCIQGIRVLVYQSRPTCRPSSSVTQAWTAASLHRRRGPQLPAPRRRDARPHPLPARACAPARAWATCTTGRRVAQPVVGPRTPRVGEEYHRLIFLPAPAMNT